MKLTTAYRGAPSAICVLLASTLVMTACAGPVEDSSDGSTGEEVLRIGRPYDIATMDPALMVAAGDNELASTLYNGLLRFKLGTTELEGDLATDWAASKDGLVWTFTLRDDAVFHKGYGPVTPEDVAYSLERQFDESLAAPKASNLSAIESVEPSGEWEVTITLKEHSPELLQNLASNFTKIVSKKAVEEKGDNFGLDPIGSGPFQYESWQTGQRLVLSSFDDYHEGVHDVERIEYVPIPDPTTLFGAFDAADIDMVQITDQDRYAKYQAADGVNIEEAPMLSLREVLFNTELPPFDSAQVREAATFAIDREKLFTGLIGDLGVPADNFLPPGSFFREENLIDYKYDPEQAKKLLADAGIETPVEVTLTVPNIARFTEPATVIQQDMDAAGFKVNLDVRETQAVVADIVSEPGLSMVILSQSFTPDPGQSLNSFMHSRNIPSTNWSRVDDPALDALLDEASVTVDESAREALLREAQHVIAQGNYGYLIDNEKYIWATKSFVNGFVADPLRSLRLDKVTMGE